MAAERTSSYLAYLPALFHEDPFVGRFLLAFERILSGLRPLDVDDRLPEHPGVEEIVDRLHTYLDPAETPRDFLPWLASWVALSLREDWKEEERRALLSRIVSIYRKRGTKAGLQDFLKIFTRERPVIYEFDEPVHYFQVEMTVQDPAAFNRIERIARAIIDQEKPAHTIYKLLILVPTMQIVDTPPKDKTDPPQLVLGENTRLGTRRLGTQKGGA